MCERILDHIRYSAYDIFLGLVCNVFVALSRPITVITLHSFHIFIIFLPSTSPSLSLSVYFASCAYFSFTFPLHLLPFSSQSTSFPAHISPFPSLYISFPFPFRLLHFLSIFLLYLPSTSLFLSVHFLSLSFPFTIAPPSVPPSFSYLNTCLSPPTLLQGLLKMKLSSGKLQF